MKFKVGDRVEATINCSGSIAGHVYTVDSRMALNDTCCDCQNGWKLVEENNLSNKSMTLKEKFTQIFLTEPEKSFRKAGVTNGDGVLTDEGEKVFLTWLLKKNGAEFKTEVVDPILADEEGKVGV